MTLAQTPRPGVPPAPRKQDGEAPPGAQGHGAARTESPRRSKAEGSSDCPHPDPARSSSRPLEGHVAPASARARATTCPDSPRQRGPGTTGVAVWWTGTQHPAPASGSGASTRCRTCGGRKQRGCHSGDCGAGAGTPGFQGHRGALCLRENPSPRPPPPLHRSTANTTRPRGTVPKGLAQATH